MNLMIMPLENTVPRSTTALANGTTTSVTGPADTSAKRTVSNIFFNLFLRFKSDFAGQGLEGGD